MIQRELSDEEYEKPELKYILSSRLPLASKELSEDVLPQIIRERLQIIVTMGTKEDVSIIIFCK